ncbi:MAG TPA: FAD-dependent oxidoreductase [Pyrinomonadaceae bacterium]|jgi:2-polyprenyl-6-methoxyphenol hydroxylase-like FAD-dependent oxidoreductase
MTQVHTQTIETAGAEKEARKADEAREVRQTTCCIVGGGPAGVILALLLARQKIDVVLLEAHDDFERDFRGDTIHPSVLEILDELGLAERLLEIRHSRISQFTVMTPDGPLTLADLSRLKTRFPYIAMLPQSDFLEFVVKELEAYPNFHLTMGARVEELIEEDGVVRGVRYREADGWHEVRASLTVAADGRGSRMRHLSGMEPIKTSPPMDVLWFRLPREASDGEGLLARFSRGHIVVMLDRLEQWQVAYVILKGSYSELRAAGIETFRRTLVETVPEFANRAEHLKEWKQVSMLSVESSRLKEWFMPGLLLIGDAAHVMSPVGGVGINYAIQDAVVAANVLTKPLRDGNIRTDELREVQRQRERPTRIIQSIQAFIQQNVIGNALNPNQAFSLPLPIRILTRIPILRDIPARIIAFGVRRVHVKQHN